jgi:hypothetical protein
MEKERKWKKRRRRNGETGEMEEKIMGKGKRNGKE